MMPFYGFIPYGKHRLSHLFTFPFTHHSGTSDVRVHTTVLDGVPYYLLQVWPYFGEEGEVYGGWDWDTPRYILFNQVVLAAAWELRQRLGWFPDVFHAHDWHTGLIPFLVSESRSRVEWQNVRTMLTIHNIAYQGEHAGGFLFNAGIPRRYQPDLVYQNLTDNLLGIGIAYANTITTVSPRYAVEIHYPYMGFGLDGLIRARTSGVYGILNGLDMTRYDPATDRNLVSNFSVDDAAEGRLLNKRQLQKESGLDVRDDVPLIGFVNRIDKQKGLDLALPALRRILLSTDMQFVGLGKAAEQAGQEEQSLEYDMMRLGQDFSWRAKTYIEFNPRLAQLIYGGCDIFLMPSHYEPCGTGQMIAMRYGALPLVRETGGLADTVDNYDNGNGDYGTGFMFNWTETQALLNTIRWALDTYHGKKDAWRRMQARAMQIDFSWDKSALAYIDLYKGKDSS
jgi:starch synthase